MLRMIRRSGAIGTTQREVFRDVFQTFKYFAWYQTAANRLLIDTNRPARPR
jgi:hypothetical protein